MLEVYFIGICEDFVAVGGAEVTEKAAAADVAEAAAEDGFDEVDDYVGCAVEQGDDDIV